MGWFDLNQVRVETLKSLLAVDHTLAPMLAQIGICAHHIRELMADAKLEAIAMREIEGLIMSQEFSDETWRKCLDEVKLRLEAQWNNVLESRVVYDKQTGRRSFRR